MAEKSQEQRPARQLEVTYPRNELIRDARAIFGVGPEVVIGALYGVNKQELTVSEVRQAIKAFLQAKPR
ncbi:MAG: hypothetical protein IMX00_04240 [Limnochordales bacterium]|nr:hypothetical protein [Limnochordales bacterium]